METQHWLHPGSPRRSLSSGGAASIRKSGLEAAGLRVPGMSCQQSPMLHQVGFEVVEQGRMGIGTRCDILWLSVHARYVRLMLLREHSLSITSPPDVLDAQRRLRAVLSPAPVRRQCERVTKRPPTLECLTETHTSRSLVRITAPSPVILHVPFHLCTMYGWLFG